MIFLHDHVRKKYQQAYALFSSSPQNRHSKKQGIAQK